MNVSDEQSIEDLRRRMWGAFEARDYQRAIDAGERAWALSSAASADPGLVDAEISHNLAELYRLCKRLGPATAAVRRAIEIRRRLVGPDHPLLANSLGTLAKIQDEGEDLAGSEQTYEQVMSIRRAHQRSAEIELAESLADYGVLLRRREKLEASAACFREAREIFERREATQTWSYAALLTNEGGLLREHGEWERAEDAYAKALAIMCAIYGDGDPRAVPVMLNLAELHRERGRLADCDRLHDRLDQIAQRGGADNVELRLRIGNRGLLRGDQGRYEEALADLQQAAGLDAQALRDVFGFATEDQMLSQMRSLIGHAYAFLTLLQEHFSGEAEASRLAHALILGRKAVVQDWLAAVRRSGDGRSQPLQLSDVDVDEVVGALPEGSALIEYFKYAPYRFASYPGDGQPRWGAPRYLALVIRARPIGTITSIDLGAAAAIDEAAARLRYAVAEGRDMGGGPDDVSDAGAAKVAGASLRRLVFDRLGLDGVKRLFVAPDGELSLVPFEVMPAGEGSHLIDDVSVSYLSSGRDIVRPGGRAAAAAPPVVLAHPNYDLSMPGAPAVESGEASSLTSENRRRPGPFGPLPATRSEGIEVARLLGVQPILDDDAIEAVLQRTRGPQVLHIATHGFFFSSPTSVAAGAEGPLPDRDAMRRAGLALAGANTFWGGGALPDGAGDGVLYAEDIAALDLVGTELAVLSACDTGRGDVRAGEGIFGLRRAFVLAGAETLVISLWRANDTRTKELMIKFHELLASSALSYPAALRSAQLWLKETYDDPAIWGAFICQSPRS